ncbi:MAG: hypothetical protein J6B87_06140 [Clostridia bacterium]|nr:hypothetical protein [Clostridia bacterium]
MVIKYGADIDSEAIVVNLKRITNQIYKLLPNREEGIDWEIPLTTIMEELSGMDRLLIDQHEILFSLLSKLEGLFILINEEDFFQYRRTIFECLSLMSSLKENVCIR